MPWRESETYVHSPNKPTDPIINERSYFVRTASSLKPESSSPHPKQKAPAPALVQIISPRLILQLRIFKVNLRQRFPTPCPRARAHRGTGLDTRLLHFYMNLLVKCLNLGQRKSQCWTAGLPLIVLAACLKAAPWSRPEILIFKIISSTAQLNYTLHLIISSFYLPQPVA